VTLHYISITAMSMIRNPFESIA